MHPSSVAAHASINNKITIDIGSGFISLSCLKDILKELRRQKKQVNYLDRVLYGIVRCLNKQGKHDQAQQIQNLPPKLGDGEKIDSVFKILSSIKKCSKKTRLVLA